MSTKLTQDQVKQLYKFTRSHYVEHYDLQTELVDHLAHGIEQLQNENPSLSFQEALNLEFKKFGVFGFHDVIAERTKGMSKKYRGILWRFFVEWFRLPKLLLTVTLILIYYFLLQSFELASGKSAFFWASYVLPIGFLFYRTLNMRKKLKNKEKKWMLEDIIFNQVAMVNLLVFPVYLFNSFKNQNPFSGDFFQWAISIFFVLVCILVYSITIVIPSKSEKLLEETYPEYKMI